MGREQAQEPDGTRADVRVPSDGDGEALTSFRDPEESEPEWHPSADWLAGEDRADEDVRTGRVRRFASVDELLADLHAASTETKHGAD